MDYQTFIDPNMQQPSELEANELSFDLDEFINQYTLSSETWNNENFDWMAAPPQEPDVSLWGDLQLTAAQHDLTHTTPSGFSEMYVPFEEFEQFFYSSPESQPRPSPPESSFSSSDSLILDVDSLSPSTNTETQPSPQSTTSSSSDSIHKCHFCPQTFEKRHLLNRHEKLHTKPVSCPISGCSHSTAKRRDMQRHIVVHHRDHDSAIAGAGQYQASTVVVPQFMCPVEGCKNSGAGRGFKRKDHLVRHLKRLHSGVGP